MVFITVIKYKVYKNIKNKYGHVSAGTVDNIKYKGVWQLVQVIFSNDPNYHIASLESLCNFLSNVPVIFRMVRRRLW